MAPTIEALRIPGGWRVEALPLTLDAEAVRLDRGIVRATLSVYRAGEIVFRDSANLTTSRGRAKVLAALAKKGVEADEDLLLGLDEASRQPAGPDAPKNRANPSGIAGTPPP